MQIELERVIQLQSSWSRTKTAEMDERGTLVRHGAAGWLRDRGGDLAAAVGLTLDDLLVEGRDGTGLYSRVPWVRFGSKAQTPSATDGFYVVYLWAADGSAVYLSLNQGTTDFVSGEFRRKQPATIAGRVAWARSVVAEWIADRDDLVPLALQDAGANSLGSGYELGEIATIRYVAGEVPGDDVLASDAADFAAALGQLYRAQSKAPLPDEVPELDALAEAADVAAGKKRPPRAAGFLQNKDERDLIEQHAVQAAKAYYADQGWKVEVKGAPYDLRLTREGQKWTVEVKGTTSQGQAVALTRGEVEHHAKAYPNNALVVMRNIKLDRSTSPPTVSGGELFEQQPWRIDDASLRVVSYRYEVGGDLYDPT
ncbi:MrcB family domain-containing protein [Patulibacter sp.]|uniref:MrcB family domain-containing protein n=1 Tax=Patulibacter sp. TaxID=1912859 RepID=UPI00271C8879|nr:DUF3578 domain-containing protein [Patulibacter sp.]MDO9409693.1 DUF3578 domain-containing protein [Patulibacter sp.]